MKKVTVSIETDPNEDPQLEKDHLLTRDGDGSAGTSTEDENGDIKPPGGNIPDKTKAL